MNAHAVVLHPLFWPLAIIAAVAILAGIAALLLWLNGGRHGK